MKGQVGLIDVARRDRFLQRGEGRWHSRRARSAVRAGRSCASPPSPVMPPSQAGTSPRRDRLVAHRTRRTTPAAPSPRCALRPAAPVAAPAQACLIGDVSGQMLALLRAAPRAVPAPAAPRRRGARRPLRAGARYSRASARAVGRASSSRMNGSGICADASSRRIARSCKKPLAQAAWRALSRAQRIQREHAHGRNLPRPWRQRRTPGAAAQPGQPPRPDRRARPAPARP